MKKSNLKDWLRLCIITASLLLLVSGLLFGNLTEGIYQKAVTICLECIGIG